MGVAVAAVATAARSEVAADEARFPAVIAFACDTEAVLAAEGIGVGPREHQGGLLGGRFGRLLATAGRGGSGLLTKDLANEVLLLIACARGHSGEIGAPEWCCDRALRRKISCEERLASRS